MMKDDGLLKGKALKAFADIANSLTEGVIPIHWDSQFPSLLFTGCGMRFAHVESLWPNRGVNDSHRGRNWHADFVP
jgi:hypothetical protein